MFRKTIVLFPVVLLLAGCSSVARHPEAYYLKHPKAMAKARSWCHLPHPGKAREYDCRNAEAAEQEQINQEMNKDLNGTGQTPTYHLPHFSW